MEELQEVPYTERISFDPTFKTFRLQAGTDSLYTFCISPELTLEHLYWGKKLYNFEEYDLRYLSQSCRNAHFNTVEAEPLSFDDKILSSAETLEEIQKTWKEANKGTKTSSSKAEEDYAMKCRLANYSWRIMSRVFIVDKHISSNDSLRALSLPPSLQSQSFDRERDRERDTDVLPTTARNRSHSSSAASNIAQQRQITRGRSFSFHFPKLNEDALHVEPSPAQRVLSDMKKTFERLSRRPVQTFERQIGKLGKGVLNVEYTDHGTGDFRSPSFMVVDNFNGSTISPLRYRSHRIYKGKPVMPDNMPSIRCVDENDASTLVVTLCDTVSGLEVDLVYVAMHAHECITRRAVFRNCDTRVRHALNSKSGSSEHSKVIQKASSLTVDFESSAAPFHMVQLSGSWGRERNVIETKLVHGMQSFGSTRGVSSHQHNPFAAITSGYPSESQGEVRGFSLIYSGNFLVEAEQNEMGRLRFNIGIHPMCLQWHLGKDDSFSTPEAALVRSSEGLGGMSRAMHRLFLDRLIPPSWSDQNPPVLLNSWEAKYFHVNHFNVVEMAKHAAPLGIDLIVLDDGWFGSRQDDRTSLGDWVCNIEKFPFGIKGLADEVNLLGCKLGIWVEPEMVSEQSILFTSHPDWYLHVPGRPRQIGRNQMVLDLSRKEVRDYLFTALHSLLSSANIEYLKWDMNRPLTEVYSITESYQSETYHRYILGLYELQQRVTSTFPHVLLENCASGGGRFDPGMLYFSPQIWCSDNTDALVRMRIQYGTSLAYPTRCIGAHVSTVPNHVTGNSTRLRTRSFIAMSGTFGYELDITALSAADRAFYQQQIEFYRKVAPIIRSGDLYRLWDPFKVNLAAWMFVTRDKTQAIVFAFSMNSDHWSALVPRLHLHGLDPYSEYTVTEPFPNNITQSSGNLMIIESEVPIFSMGVESVVLTGDILMKAGLPVRFYTLDDSICFLLKQVKSKQAQTKSPSASDLNRRSTVRHIGSFHEKPDKSLGTHLSFL